MTPPEHFLIGVATGNIVYGTVSVAVRRPPAGYVGSILLCGFAAVLPDIDSFFGHYTSTDPWVGHRGWTHSFAGSALLAFCLAVGLSVFGIFRRIFSGYYLQLVKFFHKKETGEPNDFRFFRHLFFPFFPAPFGLLFFLGFAGAVSHMFSDMPTPASVWGGLPIYFPFKNPDGSYVRVGGWGMIGWFDLICFWTTAAAVTVSFAPAALAMMIRLFTNIVTRILSALLFSGVVGINGYLFHWMKEYIPTQKFENENQWYALQMEKMKTMPEPVQKFTADAMRLFIIIFKQVRGIP